MKRNLFSSRRPGFTLVELLTVLAIIGILAGILLPTIMGAITNTKRSASKLEIDSLAEAIERYRDKYSDYPPDGSSWEVFKRHIQKAFPQILASELALLDPTIGDTVNGTVQVNFDASSGPCIRNYSDTQVTIGNGYVAADLKVMDAAEAIVFFLGGFSSDPKKPFTGRGGPFAEVLQNSGTSYSPKRYQYNVSREAPLFEFDVSRLTLKNDSGVTYSDDETIFFGGQSVPTDTAMDLLPVYIARYGDQFTASPYVYFDSRTYFAQKSTGPYLNFYQRSVMTAGPDDPFGAIYPFFSDQPNTSKRGIPGLPFASATGSMANFVSYELMQKDKFQLIGPGLDGSYGGRIVSQVRGAADPVESAQQTIFRFPSGESINTSGLQYKSFTTAPEYGMAATAVPPGLAGRMRDNVANFSGQTVEAGAP